MEAGTRQTEAEDSGWRGGGNEGMETITAILRQAREHKGVSLKDVEGKTRIPLKYLQALEGGRRERPPGRRDVSHSVSAFLCQLSWC